MGVVGRERGGHASKIWCNCRVRNLQKAYIDGLVKDEPGWFDAARKNTFGDGMMYSQCGLADRLRSIITLEELSPLSARLHSYSYCQSYCSYHQIRFCFSEILPILSNIPFLISLPQS